MSGIGHAIIDQPIWHRRVTWLRRWLAVCGLALIAATWRLWTAQDLFPQIPFVAALRGAPEWFDPVALAGLILGLLGLLVTAAGRRSLPIAAGELARARRQETDEAANTPLAPDPSPQGEGDRALGVVRAFALLFVVSLALLVLLDQHRFQPWAYQFAIIAVVLAFAPPARGASLLRLLTVGIYFWSAVSKIDYSFLHGIGSDLISGLVVAAQLDPRRIEPQTLAALAWAFPLGELAVAGLLAIRRTRTLGLSLAVLMHLVLIVTLGPLGLKHEPGVLLWNVYFIGQNLLLFSKPSTGWPAAAGATGRLRLRDLVHGFAPIARPFGSEHLAVGLAIWLPILEPFGLVDHWPAWAVYAPGAERVTLLIDAEASEKLPAEIQRHLGPAQFASGERVLRTDLWSLEVLAIPIYPQGRFRADVAFAVADRYDLGDAATLVVESRADRVTGERATLRFDGADAIGDFAASFWVNALPRSPAAAKKPGIS